MILSMVENITRRPQTLLIPTLAVGLGQGHLRVDTALAPLVVVLDLLLLAPDTTIQPEVV